MRGCWPGSRRPGGPVTGQGRGSDASSTSRTVGPLIKHAAHGQLLLLAPRHRPRGLAAALPSRGGSGRPIEPRPCAPVQPRPAMAPVRRFSSTVSEGKTSRPSGHSVRPATTRSLVSLPASDSPPSPTVPANTSDRPMIARDVVVLPAPLRRPRPGTCPTRRRGRCRAPRARRRSRPPARTHRQDARHEGAYPGGRRAGQIGLDHLGPGEHLVGPALGEHTRPKSST